MEKETNEVVLHRNKRVPFSVILIALSFLAMFLTKDKNTVQAITWLMVIFVISFGMRPYLFTRTLDYFDGGFALSFGLGTALSFFVAWFISVVTSAPFGFAISAFSLLILCIIANVLSAKSHTHYKWSAENIEKMLFGFAIFAALFAFAFWIRVCLFLDRGRWHGDGAQGAQGRAASAGRGCLR